jgi:hypothetical protein
MKPNVDYKLRNIMHALCNNNNIWLNKTDENTEREFQDFPPGSED